MTLCLSDERSRRVELEAPLKLTGPELLALRFVSSTVVSIPFLVTKWRKAGSSLRCLASKVGTLLGPSVELAVWLFLGRKGDEGCSSERCSLALLPGYILQILAQLAWWGVRCFRQGLEKTAASSCAVAAALTGPFVQDRSIRAE